MKKIDVFGVRECSPGRALRDRLFNKITPVLLGCEHIKDSNIRLMIQANCLDMVTAVEDLIQQYELDRSPIG